MNDCIIGGNEGLYKGGTDYLYDSLFKENVKTLRKQ